MATISRTGITTGGTISPTHITNIIDALDGTNISTTIIATGSLTGVLIGTASFAVTATNAPNYVLTSATSSMSASYAISSSRSITTLSSSFATTASYVLNAVSSSFATTASYVANASSFPYTGSAQITGSLSVTGSIFTKNLSLTGSLSGIAVANAALVLDLSNIGSATKGTIGLPLYIPSVNIQIGSIYWNNDLSQLAIWDGVGWKTSQFI